jgi:hypothetical protein
MAAAARVIEARLGNSPFAHPVASAVARNAWRQIIHNLTFDPLQAEIVIDQIRILDEMTSLKPPPFPSREGRTLGIGYDESAWQQYQKATDGYERQLAEYKEKLESLSRKLLDLSELANEAAKTGLSFPDRR